jgi:ABC-type Mn2+/Zn2+ transport system permease subunit
VIDWLTDPFAYAFMRNALAAGLLTVVAGSLVGTWVVLRGLAFLGDAIAHGVLPGVAIAFLVGGDLLVGAALSALVMIGGVALVGSRTRVGEDTAIGLLFVGMLAAGVAIISRRGTYAGDLTAILFGDPVGVSPGAVRTIGIATILTVAVTVIAYRPFLALSYSRDKARVLGLRPGLAHVTMLALVALVVVAAFRTVGTLLVFAFLVAPPATGAVVARRVPTMMAAAIVSGAVAVVAGLLVSFHLALAAAPTIAALCVAQFLLVLAVRDAIGALRRRAPAAPTGASA